MAYLAQAHLNGLGASAGLHVSPGIVCTAMQAISEVKKIRETKREPTEAGVERYRATPGDDRYS
jgi:hypothetical protein